MNTGKEITSKIRQMLKESETSGKYLYLGSSMAGGNPLRLIRVATEHGLTIAYTITGGNVPISSLNFNRLYIQ